MENLMRNHRAFTESRKAYDVKYRKMALRSLREVILLHEKEICDALKTDLGKCETESYMCEVGLTLNELSYVEKRLSKWIKPKKVSTLLANFPGKSYIYQEPFGVVLIMSPWNYPFLLCMEPLIGAIAAGNSVVLKPSNYSPATSAIIKKIVEKAFESGHVSVIEGGRAENTALLEQKFDYIFFTGGGTVGRHVMEKAAANLTPVSLELGGKSPCIVEKTANLKLAAKRIANGKFLNCGQTCVAPDYILIDESVKEEFLVYFKEAIAGMFGENPLECPTYGKIINEKHFQRLLGLIEDDKVVFGGKSDERTLKIQPTVMDNITGESPVMQEEIFGPLMPVLTYQNWDEVRKFVEKRPKPLAGYLFTTDKSKEEDFLKNVSFGGGCVNDVIMHLVSETLPFGGVGESGMGSYHGKRSFQTFSHEKSVLKKANWLDIPMRYQPYKANDTDLVKKILK